MNMKQNPDFSYCFAANRRADARCGLARFFCAFFLLGMVFAQSVMAAAPVWHTADQQTATGTGTTATVDAPSNLQAGDLIILMFTQQRSPSALGSGFTAPPGFTLIRRSHGTAGSDRPEIVAFYKIATANEPSTYTSTTTDQGSTPVWRAVSARVTGHDPIEPIGNSRGVNSGTSSVNSLTTPTIRTMGPDSLVVAARTVRSEVSNPNTPAGMTLQGDLAGTGSGDNNANGPAMRWATQEYPSQGSDTGAKSFTWTNSARAAGFTFEIRRNLPGNSPRVNGLFFGSGDNFRYPSTPYAISDQGSELYVRLIDGRLYVALVVNRSVNDMVFDGNQGSAYLSSVGWGSGGNTNFHRRRDSEYATFTLSVGDESWTWRQGLADQPGLSPAGNGNSGYDRAEAGWVSGTGTGGGSAPGTEPPTYVAASSLAWNMNRYAQLSNVGQNVWTMPGSNTAGNSWKSPWVGADGSGNPAENPNSAIDPAEGHPGPSGTPSPTDDWITFSDTYQWEWAMVYEWSVDFADSAFGDLGSTPIFVITGSSHHSPKKTGPGEDDPFQLVDSSPLSDYGDLPAPYPTLRADNGARHTIDTFGTRLGQSLDSEIDGIPHPLALGDDLDGVDDEDGVTLLTPLIPGGTAEIEVIIGGAPGYLSAFIDWNGDGTLDNVDLVSVTGPVNFTHNDDLLDTFFSETGTYVLTVNVPSNAEGMMASRWRITNQSGEGGASPTGRADSGEVEDHIFTASIGDRVWLDLNQDGIQDDGEPGFEGVTVHLYDSDDNLIDTQVTDADGNYLFTNVPAGSGYYIQVVAPPGFIFSPQFEGSDPEADSDADANGVIVVADIFPGQEILTYDAGLYAVGSIGDTVFFDWNGNGVQDAGEAGIPGVTVQLFESNGTTLIDTQITDANGEYLFANLPPGTYVVSLPPPGTGGIPAGYTLTASPDTPVSTTHTVVLGVDEIYLLADFGYQPGGDGSIGDTVFYDVNSNGEFTPGDGDVGIPGVTVWLYHDVNGDGLLDAGDLLVGTEVTDANGNYLFENLDPNLFYLVLADDGTGSGVENFFTLDYSLTTDDNPISVTPGDFAAATDNEFLDADFGYNAPQPASLSGHVFEDVNNDGVLDGSDIRLPNVTVNLYELSPLGQRILVGSVETDPDGYYEFLDLPPGLYVVEVDTTDPDIPNGLVTSQPEYFVTLESGDNVEDLDFPFVPLIEKSVDLTDAFPGDILTYTIRANPPAAGPIQNLRVIDNVPANTQFLSASHGGVLENNRVVWNLGSTVPATQGTLTANPFIYAFRGGDTQTVWRYDVNEAEWVSIDDFGLDVGAGGAMVYTGQGGDVFALRGNNTQSFRRLNIEAAPFEAWEPRAAVDSSANVWEGGALTQLDGIVYALVGNNSTEFLSYNPQVDSWTDLEPTPGTVGRSASLAASTTHIYALRGNNFPNFWRYDPVSDTWETLASTPATMGASGADPELGGGAMGYYNGSVYVLRGDGTQDFWRYDIGTNSWSTLTPGGQPLAQAPVPVGQGAAMVFRSIRFYTMIGNGNAFYRYNIAENTWTQLPDTPEGVMAGGALASVGGVPARETVMTATPFAVRDGDVITIQVDLSACGNCPNDTNIGPPPLIVTGEGGPPPP